MKTTLTLMAALMLGACVDAPPTTPQVAEVNTSTLGLNGAPGPHFTDAWWSAFKDPQVDRLAVQVMQGNPTLAGALARIRAAEAQYATSQTNLYPQVSLDGSAQRELLSNTYIIPPPYGGTWRWVSQLQGNLTWSLDFWGKQAALIESARDSTIAAELDAAAARLALSGSFAQTYVNYLLAWQLSDTAATTVSEREGILKLSQGRFDAGLESATAVEQAKALLAQARAEQLQILAERDMDVHAIAALAGLGASEYSDIVRPKAHLEIVLPLPKALPTDLLSRRPDVLAAQARVHAAAKGREAAHAEFYPDINLTGLIGFQSIGLSDLLTRQSFTVGAGPAIHLPIFDAGRIRAQYAGATAELDAAVADYNGTVVNAIKQVADALTQVKSLEAQRVQQKIALDSASRAFMLAQTRYRDGLSDQLTMLTAEQTLTQAREQMATIIANAATQRITLLLAAGGSFTPPPEAIMPSTTSAQQDASNAQ